MRSRLNSLSSPFLQIKAQNGNTDYSRATHNNLAYATLSYANGLAASKRSSEAVAKYREALRHFDHYSTKPERRKAKVHLAIANYFSELEESDSVSLYIDQAMRQMFPSIKPDQIKEEDIYADNVILESLKLKAHLLSKSARLKKDYLIAEKAIEKFNQYFIAAALLAEASFYENAEFNLVDEFRDEAINAVDLCHYFFELTQDGFYIKAAFEFAEAARDGQLYRSVAKARAAQEKLTPEVSDLLNQQRELNSRFNELKHDYQSGTISHDEYFEIAAEVDIKLQSANSRLESLFPPQLLRPIHTDLPSLEGLQNQLESTRSLIHFTLSDSNLYAIHITSRQLEFTKIGLSHQDISAAQEVIEALSKKRQIDPDKSARLNALLLQSFELKKSITVFADGWINFINIEFLKSDHDAESKYLLFEHSVSYQTSARLMSLSNNESAKAKYDFIGIAPTFEYDDGFPYLPYSNEEIKGVASLLKDTRYFFNESANREALTNFGKQSKVLHINAHAFASSSQAEKAWVALYNDQKKNRHPIPVGDLQFRFK